MYSETERMFDKGVHKNVWKNQQTSKQTKIFLSSFSFFFSIGVSPTRGTNCEITAQTCQPPFETITVTPKDSKVSLKCSIKTGGNVQDMTWQSLERNLSASKGLYLLQNYSTNENQSRRCFSIKYASECFLLFPLLYFLVYIKTSWWIIFGLLFTCIMNDPWRPRRWLTEI